MRGGLACLILATAACAPVGGPSPAPQLPVVDPGPEPTERAGPHRLSVPQPESAPLECEAPTREIELLRKGTEVTVACGTREGDEVLLHGPARREQYGLPTFIGAFHQGHPTGRWQRWRLPDAQGQEPGLLYDVEFSPPTDAPAKQRTLDDTSSLDIRVPVEQRMWLPPGSHPSPRTGHWLVGARIAGGRLQLVCEGDFVEDERHGEWKCFHRDGDAAWFGEYDRGQPKGRWSSRFPGSRWWELRCEFDDDGRLHGELSWRHRNGARRMLATYDHGKIVDEQHWDELGLPLRADPHPMLPPFLYAPGTEDYYLAHIDHGGEGATWMAGHGLLRMKDRKNDAILDVLWKRRKRIDEAYGTGMQPGDSNVLLLALFDADPKKYQRDVRALQSFRGSLGDSTERYKFIEWYEGQGDGEIGGLYDWAAEAGLRMMTLGELPYRPAMEMTVRALKDALCGTSTPAEQRLARRVLALIESPSFSTNVQSCEASEPRYITWLRTAMPKLKWNRRTDKFVAK